MGAGGVRGQERNPAARAGNGSSRPSNPGPTSGRSDIPAKGSPGNTNRNSTKTTKTTTPTYSTFSYLTSKSGGYKYENNVDKYAPTLLPVHDPNNSNPLVDGRLARGSMVFASDLVDATETHASTGIGYGNDQYKFNFFYNPTAIHVESGLWTDQLPPGSINADKYFQNSFPATETVSWEILLDRTQDAYYNASSPGTLQDLYVLYGLINGGDPPDGYNLGFLYMTPVTVSFGSVASAFLVGQNLWFQGYITQLSYDHQRFSQYMIPNLTNVNFSLTRISKPPANTFTFDKKGQPTSKNDDPNHGRGTA